MKDTAADELRGHEICKVGGEWFYRDSGEKTAGNRRNQCGHCGLVDTPEGCDGCLGELPGVTNACCGHGNREESYVQFTNGTTVRGFTIDSEQR